MLQTNIFRIDFFIWELRVFVDKMISIFVYRMDLLKEQLNGTSEITRKPNFIHNCL